MYADSEFKKLSRSKQFPFKVLKVSVKMEK